MFGWFKRKSKPDEAQKPNSELQTAPEAAHAAIASTPAPSSTHAAPVTMNASAQDPQPLHLPATNSELKFRVRINDAPPPGTAMVEVCQNRQRPAEVIRTQGGGRRVLARVQESGRVYAYTRRDDGTFRLEQAPTTNAAKLIPAEA